MDEENLLARITVDPRTFGGKIVTAVGIKPG